MLVFNTVVKLRKNWKKDRRAEKYRRCMPEIIKKVPIFFAETMLSDLTKVQVMSLSLLSTICWLNRVDASEDSCTADKTDCSNWTDVASEIQLDFVLDNKRLAADGSNSKLFFVETSGRDHLTPRQACAVESAARFANVPIFVVISSRALNLDKNNATKQVYQRLVQSEGGTKVTFVQAVDAFQALAGTPLHNESVWRKVDGSPRRVAHVSDALRLALVYKFGGWYADIDTVIMKPLTDFPVRQGDTFYIASDQSFGDTDADGSQVAGAHLANGFFGALKSNSKFLWRSMELFLDSFDSSRWASGGAIPMTMALREFCSIPNSDHRFITVGGRYAPEQCNGIHVVKPSLFYPYSWYFGKILFENKKTVDEWSKFFEGSYSVDFYQTSLKQDLKIMRPKMYGARLPAYAHLGPLYCPLSFSSERFF